MTAGTTGNKPFESRGGKIVLIVIGVLIGGLIGEPLKNYVNRAQVDVNIVSLKSTTPSKSSWKLNLTPASQDSLAFTIAGEDWVNDVRSNNVSFGQLRDRGKKLDEMAQSFSSLSTDKAWLNDPATDYIAFYESNRTYIRTVLEYVQHQPDIPQDDKRRAGAFLDTDKRVQSSILDRFPIPNIFGPRDVGGPPMNTRDIVLFAGKYQELVHASTGPLRAALSKALSDEELIEPLASFEIILDVTNNGGRVTSIRSKGSLIVGSDDRSSGTVVALSVVFDSDTTAVLSPGERKQFKLVANDAIISTADIEDVTSPDFVNRATKIRQAQIDGLRALGPLYKSGVSHCEVAITWGDGQHSQSQGEFGEAQRLNELEMLLKRE